MRKFRAGDRVYFPQKSSKVLTLKENDTDTPYIVITGTDAFTEDGKYRETDLLPSLLHATEENRAKLEAFHGIPFESARTGPTSRDIIQAMLARGDKFVPCWVSNAHKNPAYVNKWVFIYRVGDDYYLDEEGTKWRYATPFDHKTEQPIAILPD